ncbi:MAG: radical SAM protein [Candidatus Rokuibacteriota bacterium]|nr:MAG: radical SAM protein [Candidatus Rokubacteria bacterium]
MTIRRRAMMKPGIAAPGMAERLGVTVDERRGVEYHQLRSKDLLNKLNARPMPFGWTLNPYRGCEMACRYCFARYTHEFLGLDDRMAFERTIYVKDADRDRLVAELRRARRSGQSVAIGTATDPYQPAEGKFEVTRRVLEAARMVPGILLSITTKSTLVTRDAALLREISAASDVTVNLSVTTVDAALARRLEPRAPRPDLRFAAMKALTDAGVAARLFIMPILPRLTDDEPNLRALLVAARRAGAIGAESNVLFLRPGTREIFLEFLAIDFPRLVPEYERLYRGSAYAPPDYVREIEERVRRLADEVGLSSRRRADRPDQSSPRQLSLAW